MPTKFEVVEAELLSLLLQAIKEIANNNINKTLFISFLHFIIFSFLPSLLVYLFLQFLNSFYLYVNEKNTFKYQMDSTSISASRPMKCRTNNIHSCFPPDASVNLLTNPALDPIGKIPEYKVCAVKVEAV